MNNKTKKTAVEIKAVETIEKYGMLDGVKNVLVGVSGGADSMCLLHFLCSLREKRGIKVYAAHVNHMLRGAEADRDENYVKAWCKENDVPLFVLHADVKKLAAEHNRATEEEGRHVRYDFFAEKSKEINAVTATAHTLSDTIETQIMNYARGAGINGICGIPPKRNGLIRPLIRSTRKETEEYCKSFGIEYLNDSTNFSRDFTRNHVRLDLVPILYGLNPSFDKAAARLIDSLEEDAKCLHDLAVVRLKKAVISNGVYNAEILTKDCPKAVLSRCISIAAVKYTDRAQEYKHISAIIDMLEKRAGRIEIVGGAFCELNQGRLRFYKKSEIDAQDNDFSTPFVVGMHKIGEYQLSIVTISYETLKNLKNVNKESFKNAVDCDKIKGIATVRTKKQGDKLSPVSRNVTKSLKKLFNEEKIPVEERAVLPVAADENGVFWAASIGADERVKVTDTTKHAALLKIKKAWRKQTC